jgi:hypothetical protein
MDTGRSHPLPLLTIRAAYAELGRSVDVALRTQMGDAARLGVQRLDCLRLLALTELVCVLNDFAVEWLELMFMSASRYHFSRRTYHHRHGATFNDRLFGRCRTSFFRST